MWTLARQERFEEAAEVRDRGALLERTLCRESELRALLDAGEVVIAHEGRAHLIRNGQLAASAPLRSDGRDGDRLRAAARSVPVDNYWPPDARAEAVVVASWLKGNARDARVLSAERSWALPATARMTAAFSVRKLP
jgi:hypothetical protein